MGKNNKRLSYEVVKKLFEEKGFILLSKEYKNNHTKMDCICVCGNKTQLNLKHLLRDVRCMKCSGTKRYTFDEVKTIFEKEGCQLLVDEYINNYTKMEYLCSCGNKNVTKINLNSFLMGKRCKKCGSVRGGLKIRGEKNPNWNPDLDEQERKLGRKTLEYKEWRTKVFKRDNCICQCCGKKGFINAHHLESFKNNKHLRLDINNGITLCKECHKEFHRMFGYKNTTSSKLFKYLKFVKETLINVLSTTNNINKLEVKV